MNEPDYITPSFVGHFVKLNRCHRFFNLSRDTDISADPFKKHSTSDFIEAFAGGGIVETHTGTAFEDDVYTQLCEHDATAVFPLDSMPGEENEDSDNDSPSLAEEAEYTADILNDIVQNITSLDFETATSTPLPADRTKTKSTHPHSKTAARNLTEPVLLYQPTLTGTIGSWNIGGDADFIVIWPRSNGGAVLRVIDVKVAVEEKTHHQIQASIYATLLEQTLVEDGHNTDNFSIETGILTPDGVDEVTQIPTPDAWPVFDHESQQADLNNLFKKNGDLDNAADYADFDDITYRLDEQYCSRCEFNEACYIDSIENDRLETLGFNESSLTTLNRAGINTLSDLTTLLNPVDTTRGGANHRNGSETILPADDEPAIADDNTYKTLSTHPDIGRSLSTHVQDAQALLGAFYNGQQSANRHIYDGKYAHGYYSAPPTELPFWNPNAEYASNTPFIQIYFNIQEDHIQDSIIGIGAYITVTYLDDAGQINSIENTITSLQTTVTLDRDKAQANEKTFLADFATDLIETLRSMESDIGTESAFIQGYTYTQRENALLTERLNKHTSTQVSATGTNQTSTNGIGSMHTLKALLNPENDISHPTIIPLKPIIGTRFATQTPTNGLLNLLKQFSASNTGSYATTVSWTYTPDDRSRLPPGESHLNLRVGMGYRFLNNEVNYETDANGITFYADSAHGYYPVRIRTAAQIPLGYVWAGIGHIDDDWVSELDDPARKGITNKYRYYDAERKTTRITDEDISVAMTRLAKALQNIESGIPQKVPLTDASVEETPS